MYIIMFYTKDDRMCTICTPDNIPLQFNTQEEAWDMIMDIQMQDVSNIKLMWVSKGERYGYVTRNSNSGN